MKEIFIKSIVENGQQDVDLLAFADWLEENNKKETAKALRWLVKYTRRPYFRTESPGIKKPWIFISQDRGTSNAHSDIKQKFPACVINHRLFPHYAQYTAKFVTWEDAVTWLANCIFELENIL